MMAQWAGWLAPAATMAAALMTASNLGARVTGWGFVVFTLGSAAWCAVAVTSDQANLLWTNGFLMVVNLVGVWRWLGRAARFEQGGEAAAQASLGSADLATVLPLGQILGGAVTGADGQTLGRVVDVVMRCGDLTPAYFVVSDGGVAGVGEKLYGLSAAELNLEPELRAAIDGAALARRATLRPDDWPAQLSRAQGGGRLPRA